MPDARRGTNTRKPASLCFHPRRLRANIDLSVPTAKALDLFRPGYDIDQLPINSANQKTYTARINITFRFYRPGQSLASSCLRD